MFSGRSPRGKFLPYGERDQPFGSLTGSGTCAKIAVAMVIAQKKMPMYFLMSIDLIDQK
jgi:hypothetical protein